MLKERHLFVCVLSDTHTISDIRLNSSILLKTTRSPELQPGMTSQERWAACGRPGVDGTIHAKCTPGPHPMALFIAKWAVLRPSSAAGGNLPSASFSQILTRSSFWGPLFDSGDSLPPHASDGSRGRKLPCERQKLPSIIFPPLAHL